MPVIESLAYEHPRVESVQNSPFPVSFHIRLLGDNTEKVTIDLDRNTGAYFIAIGEMRTSVTREAGRQIAEQWLLADAAQTRYGDEGVV